MAFYERPDESVRQPLREYPERTRTIILMLIEYNLHGCWQISRGQKKTIPKSEELVSGMDSFYHYFQIEKQVSPHTFKNVKRYVIDFVIFLEANGIESWGDVTPRSLSGFLLTKSNYSPVSLKHVTYALRALLKYLYEENLIQENLANQLPRIHIPAELQLPSVWKKADLAKLLATVDRGSPVGKRDYALLLLVSRLGIRANDVRQLRLDDIHWDKSRIVIKQSKTGKSLTLPLLEEVGEAIIDYLRNGRPPSHYRELFLTARVPIEPFNRTSSLHHVIVKYRRKAGILARGKGGLHSLRHTVACRLLEEGTPFETISDILGHSSVESTRTYARVDIEGLRSVALDPEEVIHV